MLDRIVVIHDRIEARGGATHLARLSAIQYRKLGHPVTYITGAKDDASLDEYGITTLSVGQSGLSEGRTGRAALGGIYNQKAVQLISDWIAEHDTPNTAYHLHNWAQILSPGVFRSLEPVAARTVVSCHDFFNVCPNGGLLHFPSGRPCELKPMSAACWRSQCDRRSAADKYWRVLRHASLQKMARFNDSEMTFVCLHEGMEKIMRSAGFSPPRLFSIPNPATAYASARVRAEDNASFLYIGRLSREKGADLAYDVARQAKIPMTFVGEGELFDALTPECGNIKFAGFCDRGQLSEYAKSARAVIVPGRWREPYGLVVAEAALSGIPVIISEPSSLASKVDELKFGQVFDPFEEGSLLKLILEWRDDDALIKRMSESAFNNAGEICSSEEGWGQSFVDLMQDRIRTSLT